MRSLNDAINALIVAILWVACPSAAQQVEIVSTFTTAAQAPTSRENITIPITIYILEDEDGRFSSERTKTDVELLIGRSNEIWSNQANIVLELAALEKVAVPTSLLRAVSRRQFRTFWDTINRGGTEIKRRSTPVWGFYVRGLGGINGVQPTNSRAFFVADDPTVMSHRTTAHEIGHLLRLYHDTNARRLMFSGSNGTEISEEEKVVARYVVLGMLNNREY